MKGRIGKRPALFALAGVLALAIGHVGPAQSAGDAFDTARKLIAADKPDKAASQLTRTLADGKLSKAGAAQAYLYRGQAYLKLGKSAQAISDLTLALWFKGLPAPDRLLALKLRSEAYKQAGLKKRASEDLARAASLDPARRAARAAGATRRVAKPADEAAFPAAGTSTTDAGTSTKGGESGLASISGIFDGLFSSGSKPKPESAPTPRSASTPKSVSSPRSTPVLTTGATPAARPVFETVTAKSAGGPPLPVRHPVRVASLAKPRPGGVAGAAPSAGSLETSKPAETTAEERVTGWFSSLFGGASASGSKRATTVAARTSSWTARPGAEAKVAGVRPGSRPGGKSAEEIIAAAKASASKYAKPQSREPKRKVTRKSAKAIIAAAKASAAKYAKRGKAGKVPTLRKAAGKSSKRVHLELAALRSEKEAKAVASVLKAKHARLLGKLRPQVYPATIGNMGRFYRVSLGPFADEKKPLKLCARLQRSGQDCYLAVR